MGSERVFQAAPLGRAIAAIVAAGGSDAREAALVAENLVAANLAGHDSHGVGMIPRYVAALREGGLKPNRRVRVTADAGALLAVDGDSGYGQAVGQEATEMAIACAKAHGVCVLALANAHHLGRIGHFAERAVAEGLASIHFVNVISYARVAPFGGRDARFGTNPCTIALPLPGEPPFVLDFATSAVAQGKLRVARNKGEKVPPGILLDNRGDPSDDPRWGVVPPFGAMLPFGLHKGYGLAVACELLGGALTGGGTFRDEKGGRQRVLNGMLTILFEPARLGTAESYAREARAFLAWLRQSRPAADFDRVRIAGEPERECRARRERDGVPVDGETWREILAAGAVLGVDGERVERIARGA